MLCHVLLYLAAESEISLPCFIVWEVLRIERSSSPLDTSDSKHLSSMYTVTAANRATAITSEIRLSPKNTMLMGGLRSRRAKRRWRCSAARWTQAGRSRCVAAARQS